MRIFRKIFPFLVLILLVVVIYWPFFFQGKIPFPGDLLIGAYYPWLDYKWGTITGVAVKNPNLSDVFSHILPLKYLVIDTIRSGQLPLWNPQSFSGSPLLANYNSAPLFFANLILFLPKYYSWALFILGQTLFAALGIFVYLKKYTLNIFIKLIAALVFSLSSLMSTWAEFGGGVWAMALLPWILFFIDRYLDRRQISSLILMSLALASLYFAGNYQIAIFGSLLVGLYLIFQIYDKTLLLKDIIPITTYIILAISLSALVLFPAYSQSLLSVRSSEVYSQAYNYGLVPLKDFIRIFAADFFGNPTTYNYRGSFVYYENSPFLGTLVLPLILPLLLKPFRNKKNLFWWAVLFFSFILALDSPLTQFIYQQHIPFLTYSSASRILFFTSLSAAILCVQALKNLIKDQKYRQLTKIFCLIFILILSICLIPLKLSGPLPDFTVSFRNSVIPIFLLISLAFILQLSFFKKLYLPIIFLLFFFDLSHYFWKFNPFINASLIFPKTPSIDFLQQQPGLFRVGRLNREILTPNTWIQYHLYSIEGYDPLSPQNYSRYFNRVNQNKYFDGINRYTELYVPDYNFLKSLNTKYLLSVNNEKTHTILTTTDSKNLKEVFTDKSVTIYENQNYLDRAYFVKNTITVNNHQELAKIIDDPKYNPLTKTVILSENKLPDSWALGKINIKSYQNNLVAIDTENSADAFLVLADTYDPGWQAYLDGQATKIYEVNGALRGVIIPKGEHNLIMKYLPKSVDLGLKVSLTSLLIMLLLSIYLFIKNKCHH